MVNSKPFPLQDLKSFCMRCLCLPFCPKMRMYECMYIAEIHPVGKCALRKIPILRIAKRKWANSGKGVVAMADALDLPKCCSKSQVEALFLAYLYGLHLLLASLMPLARACLLYTSSLSYVRPPPPTP